MAILVICICSYLAINDLIVMIGPCAERPANWIISTLIPLSAAKVGSYLTYFQSKVIYFGSRVIGSENTAACSPSVSICNRAVGSWTKSFDLVQKIPLPFLFSLPSHRREGRESRRRWLEWQIQKKDINTNTKTNTKTDTHTQIQKNTKYTNHKKIVDVLTPADLL